MLFLYNEVYLDIIDFEFNENKNNFFISFNNTTFLHVKNPSALEKARNKTKNNL